MIISYLHERNDYYNFAACIIQCTPDNTGVPDVSESRFSVPGERLMAKAQVFYQRELTLRATALVCTSATGEKSFISLSHSVTLLFCLHFHSVTSLPFLPIMSLRAVKSYHKQFHIQTIPIYVIIYVITLRKLCGIAVFP